MAERHVVRFEPVGLEIEVSEDETVLQAAFRQGVMLMHGCKEGQCSACKSFLIEGEVDLERYSTFALADYEQEEGYTLLCRAHAYSDLDVELLNFDEEMLKSGVPIQTVQTEVAAIEPRSEEHTSELQSHSDLVCRLLLEKKKKNKFKRITTYKKKKYKKKT